MGTIMRGTANNNLANEFELTSIKTIDVLIDEIKTGASVYDKTDSHKDAAVALLLRVIIRDLSSFDIREITDKDIDLLTRRIIALMNANRCFADPEFIAIEDAIKGLRQKQNSI